MKKLLSLVLVLALSLVSLPALAQTAPSEFVGEWVGSVPEEDIELELSIREDGSGTYTFRQRGYIETYSFTLFLDDGTFDIAIPRDNLLGISTCGGTYSYANNVLTLAVEVRFLIGGSFVYMANCTKLSGTQSAEEEMVPPATLADVPAALENAVSFDTQLALLSDVAERFADELASGGWDITLDVKPAWDIPSSLDPKGWGGYLREDGLPDALRGAKFVVLRQNNADGNGAVVLAGDFMARLPREYVARSTDEITAVLYVSEAFVKSQYIYTPYATSYHRVYNFFAWPLGNKEYWNIADYRSYAKSSGTKGELDGSPVSNETLLGVLLPMLEDDGSTDGLFILPTVAPTNTPAPEPVAEDEEPSTVLKNDILALLQEPLYDATYEYLSTGNTISADENSEYGKGLQTLLVALGSDISVDGQIGSKSVSALNAAYAALGMAESSVIDAAAFERLLTCLACVRYEDDARSILTNSGMTEDEITYLRACGLQLAGLNYQAYMAFCLTGWEDANERVDTCTMAWPKNGEVYRNGDYSGTRTRLTIKVGNQDDGYASLFKIYAENGDLVSCAFVGGAGKVTVKLPDGTYTIKSGVGKIWYGANDAFGFEGDYETMLFDNGATEVTLQSGYEYTLTVNTSVSDANADGVGSEYESYEDF